MLIRRIFTGIVLGCLAYASQVRADDPLRVVHVFVALCDNEHQGIVKVGKVIGNGQDPFNNLYWGAMFGVKNHFKKSREWKLLQTEPNPRERVLERCIFRHTKQNVIMIAEAYDGRFIGSTVFDFLSASAGRLEMVVPLKKDGGTTDTIKAGGASALLVYVGHNGLMDVQIENYPKHADDRQRDVIMLACAAKDYFEKPLLDAGAYPVVWTTNLMAPEAYTLKDALDGWIANEEDAKVCDRAAAAYDRYQKCGFKAARRLLVAGFK